MPSISTPKPPGPEGGRRSAEPLLPELAKSARVAGRVPEPAEPRSARTEGSSAKPAYHVEPRNRPPSRGGLEVLDALESWRTENAETAKRTESKILRSLLALEARIAAFLDSQGALSAGEAAVDRRTVEELTERVVNAAAKSDPKFALLLKSVEARLRSTEDGIDEIRRALQKTVATAGAAGRLEAPDPSPEPRSSA